MQSKFFIYNKLGLGFLFFLWVVNAAAQHDKLKRENILTGYVFKGNHIQFNFSTLSVLKASLKNQTGNYPVNSKAALGLSISFTYKKNFNNNYSFIIGSDAAILGRNFIVAFNKNDFTPSLIQDYTIKGINSYLSALVISLPLLVEKRWLYAKTKYLFANTGIRLNFSTGADFEGFSISLKDVNNGFYDTGGTDVYANNDAKPWVSFPLNAGHSWLLKNNNLLQLAICSNISFTKYVNGTYQIIIPGKPLTEGKYSSTGSFIGLSLNYVFTNANYRIRKAYEKARPN
ncbi:MAG: hypothetical protein SGI96_10575 [Bacteroidota bacterium]|nr:hypothetical protein [Bacteroidota bacterium]